MPEFLLTRVFSLADTMITPLKNRSISFPAKLPFTAGSRVEPGAVPALPMGIINEVTALLINCVFDYLGVNRIELRCHPDNRGSVVIALKLGVRYEGTLRQYVSVPGKGLADESVNSLLSSER